jgi:hypothetical protein
MPRSVGRGVANFVKGGVTPRILTSCCKLIMTAPQPQPPRVLGDKIWCPRCGEYVKIVRVAGAAKIVDVDRRSVYGWIKKNKVFAVKVAGSTLRVCSHCLLRENVDEQPNAVTGDHA